MSVPAVRSTLKFAVAACGAVMLSQLLAVDANAQVIQRDALRRQRERRPQDIRVQILNLEELRQRRTNLGANPYQDPYRRGIYRNAYNNPFDTVGEAPVTPDVDRFRQGVERFR
ncbi:MAG: hypothetical protein AAF268_09430 [Cyanobacteria bacterium P01_A01_bin.3]